VDRSAAARLAEPKPIVLVADDEPIVVEVVERYLRRDGFRVVTASTAHEAWDAALSQDFPPSLIVLDVMLPGGDGFDICRRLRTEKGVRVPILLLTARSEEADRIAGLSIGADDYVPKPFNPRELVARIRAVLRRAGGDGAGGPGGKEPPARAIRFAGWTLEPGRRRLLNPEGVEVPLTGGEYELLQVLVERANRVLTRDMLMDLLRGRQAGPFDRAIDVAVSRLRRKLEDDGRNPQLIKTVRGGGYVLAATVERAA
jgi:two-component system, OmpR family, response regulator